MNNREFVEKFREEVLVDGLDNYLEGLRDSDEGFTENGADIISLYNKGTENEKKALEKLIHIIIADSLALIDGTRWMEGQNEDLVLTYKGEVLSGELSDTFLEIEEEQGTN